jgi:hypothetical protein
MIRAEQPVRRDQLDCLARQKVQQLAAAKPALVQLLEWQIDQELERGESGSKAFLSRP